MKPINLLSLTQAHDSLAASAYEDFARLHGITIKHSEVGDLKLLAANLRLGQPSGTAFNGYFVGYKIPQIGKEFDLLRFGSNYNVNIELKSNVDEERMRQQLLRNKYYLGYLGKPLYNLSFSSLNQQFYRLHTDGVLVRSTLEEILRILLAQSVEAEVSIDERFRPSNYLVSPFNSPDRFLSREYFLTQQQEEIKTAAMRLLSHAGKPIFISLSGSAGTGKTLLAYDIVADLRRSGIIPLIVHCGNLNSGHHSLIGAGWNIIPIKHLGGLDMTRFRAVLIDEAQRIRPNQFSSVVEQVHKASAKCIFSFDKTQTLADNEARNNIGAQIEGIPGVVSYSLSEKIRTNKEIATFIKGLFDISRNLKTPKTGNIEIIFFGNADDAKAYLSTLSEPEWKVLRFTPSQYYKEHHETYSDPERSTSHGVIGQEFDGVAVVVDEFFSYNQHGNLIYTGSTYYQPVKMLFQNLTRARIRLRIVIINNPRVLGACMNILQ